MLGTHRPVLHWHSGKVSLSCGASWLTFREEGQVALRLRHGELPAFADFLARASAAAASMEPGHLASEDGRVVVQHRPERDRVTLIVSGMSSELNPFPRHLAELHNWLRLVTGSSAQLFVNDGLPMVRADAADGILVFQPDIRQPITFTLDRADATQLRDLLLVLPSQTYRRDEARSFETGKGQPVTVEAGSFDCWATLTIGGIAVDLGHSGVLRLALMLDRQLAHLDG